MVNHGILKKKKEKNPHKVVSLAPFFEGHVGCFEGCPPAYYVHFRFKTTRELVNLP